MQIFGDYLKELRESKGMTVNQLAVYSGVSAAAISRIENGKRGVPKPETIKKLSEALKEPYPEMMKVAGHLKDITETDPSPPDKQPDPLSSLGISRAHYNYDELDEDEKEFLREEIPRKLEEFRRMKAKFMEKKNSKN